MSDEGINTGRRRFLTTSATVVGGVGVLATAVPFVSTFTPSAKARAIGAPVEVDISDIKPGERKIVEWQGKPVWILRRGEETLNSLSELDSEVRDPESEQDQQPKYARNLHRSIKPALLEKIKHAGAIFIGHYTAEALGDYCAGPNHVLPTARTARFSSPLGVYDFQKRSSIISCTKSSASALARSASILAHGEGLSAHARSAELRIKD